MKRNKENDDEEDKSVIQIRKSEDDNFNSFQQELEVSEIEIVGVYGGRLDVRGVRSTNLAKTKFVSLVND
ncbi:hypothetical protein AVEN_49182-1 [Araneus ventricosus]|uniref:Uncharacterized protein n=1 Tax=Araneus ventricosus TaxID=182803 RepID=A0A4Y2J706_ARAVE|nr:hypothetical protein AVEN_49182-1 [Araneus ventricosus]